MKEYLKKLTYGLAQGIGFAIIIALFAFWMEERNSHPGGYEVLEQLPIREVKIEKKEIEDNPHDRTIVVSFELTNDTEEKIGLVKFDVDLFDAEGHFVYSSISDYRRGITPESTDFVSEKVMLPRAIELSRIDHAKVKVYSYWYKR